MKKKWLIGVLVVGVLLSLAGCGNGKEKEKADKGDGIQTITYWQHSSPARDKMIKEVVKDFEEKNQDIKVKLEFIPENDYNQKLITSLASDNAPDVFQVQSGMIYKLASAKSIQPLDEAVMSKSMIETEFIPATVEALQFENAYYGMPTDTQTIISYWNKTLYKEAKLDPEKGPDTWEEFFNNAKKLTKKDGDKLVQGGWGTAGYGPEIEAYVAQSGGTFFDTEKNEFVFADDANALKSIEEMVALYRDDKVFDGEFSAPWAGFRQNLVGEMLGHPAMIGNLGTTAPDLDLGIGAIPSKDGNRQTTITSWAYVMSKKAQSEAATKLIDYLSSEETEKKWSLETGELPARKSLLEDPELRQDEKLSVGLDSLNEAVVGRMQTGAMNAIWTEHYEKIMYTDEAVKDILKECQTKLNAELNKKL